LDAAAAFETALFKPKGVMLEHSLPLLIAVHTRLLPIDRSPMAAVVLHRHGLPRPNTRRSRLAVHARGIEPGAESRAKNMSTADHLVVVDDAAIELLLVTAPPLTDEGATPTGGSTTRASRSWASRAWTGGRWPTPRGSGCGPPVNMPCSPVVSGRSPIERLPSAL
jgi:hypothetical protein